MLYLYKRHAGEVDRSKKHNTVERPIRPDPEEDMQGSSINLFGDSDNDPYGLGYADLKDALGFDEMDYSLRIEFQDAMSSCEETPQPPPPQYIFSYMSDDEHCLLTVENINDIFTQEENCIDSIRLRDLIEMMNFLREGYRRQRFMTAEESYPGPAGEHKNANRLYPLLYELVVQGISEGAMYGIQHAFLRDRSVCPKESAKLVHGIKQDRAEMIFDPEERLEYAHRNF